MKRLTVLAAAAALLLLSATAAHAFGRRGNFTNVQVGGLGFAPAVSVQSVQRGGLFGLRRNVTNVQVGGLGVGGAAFRSFGTVGVGHFHSFGVRSFGYGGFAPAFAFRSFHYGTPVVAGSSFLFGGQSFGYSYAPAVAIAQVTLATPRFSFDAATGLFFDHVAGMWYDPASGAYYTKQTSLVQVGGAPTAPGH